MNNVYVSVVAGSTPSWVFRVTLDPKTNERPDNQRRHSPIHVRIYSKSGQNDVDAEMAMITTFPDIFVSSLDPTYALSESITVGGVEYFILAWRPALSIIVPENEASDSCIARWNSNFASRGLYVPAADDVLSLAEVYQKLRPYTLKTGGENFKMTEAFQGNMIVVEGEGPPSNSPFLPGKKLLTALQRVNSAAAVAGGPASGGVSAGRPGAEEVATPPAAAVAGGSASGGVSAGRPGAEAVDNATTASDTGGSADGVASATAASVAATDASAASSNTAVPELPSTVEPHLAALKTILFKEDPENAPARFLDVIGGNAGDAYGIFAGLLDEVVDPLYRHSMKLKRLITDSNGLLSQSPGRAATLWVDTYSYARWEQEHSSPSTRVDTSGVTAEMNEALVARKNAYMAQLTVDGTSSDDQHTNKALYNKAHYVKDAETIAGNEHVRSKLNSVLIYPKTSRLSFRRKFTSLLMWGPPGTGKTVLAANAAHTAKYVMLPISPADVTGGLVGDSEKKIRYVFNIAKDIATDSNIEGCVLFFDEIDLMVPNRKPGSSLASNTAGALGMFLTEMDLLSGNHIVGSNVLVVAATNLKSEVDAALLRRFSMQPHVQLPNVTSCESMLRKFMEKTVYQEPMPFKQLADICVARKFTGADIRRAVNEATRMAGDIYDTHMFAEYAISNVAKNTYRLTSTAGVVPYELTVYDPLLEKESDLSLAVVGGTSVWCPVAAGGSKSTEDMDVDEKDKVYIAGITVQQMGSVIKDLTVSTAVRPE